MSNNAVVEFDRKLKKLFSDRTHWLLSLIKKPKPGKAPSIDKKKVEKNVSMLQVLATKALLRNRAITSLTNLYDTKKQWRVTTQKGWGVAQKKRAFIEWFDKYIPFDNCVYAFWAKRRCRYVGRTLKGKNRPQSHFEKHWFTGVTRIDIYAARASRDISKLECLATHRFLPSHNKIKPSSRKGNSKCPICQTHKAIRSEVKSIFRLR